LRRLLDALLDVQNSPFICPTEFRRRRAPAFFEPRPIGDHLLHFWFFLLLFLLLHI